MIAICVLVACIGGDCPPQAPPIDPRFSVVASDVTFAGGVVYSKPVTVCRCPKTCDCGQGVECDCPTPAEGAVQLVSQKRFRDCPECEELQRQYDAFHAAQAQSTCPTCPNYVSADAATFRQSSVYRSEPVRRGPFARFFAKIRAKRAAKRAMRGGCCR